MESSQGSTALSHSISQPSQDSERSIAAGSHASDRFNAGWYDQALLPSDVYHEALAAYGVDSGIPERWPDFSPTTITGLRNA